MGCLLIVSTFALLQFALCSAHSLAKFQAHKGYDVYVVDENKDANRISFINPKSDKPTLREIVYYHMIEKPFPESKAAKSEGTVDDDIDTERPFTNSHGFPFVGDDKIEKNETANEQDAEKGISNMNTVEKKSDETAIDEEIEEQHPADLESNGQEEELLETSDSDQANQEIIALKEPVKNSEATTESAEMGHSNKNTIEDEQVNIENTTRTESQNKPNEKNLNSEADNEELIKFVNKLNTEKYSPVTTPESHVQSNEIDSPTTEASMSARKELFDRIKSKYGKFSHPNINQTATSNRRKRSTHHLMEIPEAPTLPGMNLGPTGRSRRSESGDAKQEIKNKIEKMFDEVSKKIKNKSADEESSDEPPKARTYGMKLTADHGVVWNNLFTNPGIKYSVGNQDASNTEDKPSEETPPESNEPEEVEDNDHTDEIEPTTTNNYDLDDIEVNINKKKGKPKEENNSEAKQEEAKEPVVNKDQQEEDKKSEESQSEDQSEKSKEEEKTKENPPKDSESDEKPNEELAPKVKSVKHDDDDSENDKKETKKWEEYEIKKEQPNRRRKPIKEHKEETHQEPQDEDKAPSIKDKKLDALNVLLGNKQFWEWLGDWTSIYMEVFVQNVGNVIKEEIKKQVTNFLKDNSTVVSENHHEHSNKMESKKDEEHDSGKLKHRPHKDNKDDRKAHKDDKKKEMNSNSTDSKSTKVVSKTMYGNSVNNQKVTNIFIFYPNEKSNKIIEDLQPILSSSDKNITIDHKGDDKKPEAHDTKLDEKKDTEAKPTEDKKPSKPDSDKHKKRKEEKKDEKKHKDEDKKPEDKTEKSDEKQETTGASSVSTESTTKAETSESSTTPDATIQTDTTSEAATIVDESTTTAKSESE